MPEGPECATVSEELRIKLLDCTIISYYTDEKSKCSGFDSNLVCPSKVFNVRFHGKKIIIELSTNLLIIASLGMNGKFQYVKGNHSHISFEIQSPTELFTLYFDDVRYFGKVDVIKNEDEGKYFSNIGPCLLKRALKEDTWFSCDEWKKIFRPKLLRRKICDILIDQSIIAGIGQYLMVEILYYSLIHPLRIGKTITDEELEDMRVCSHKIIKLSYDCGGFTLKDFISPSGTKGLYPAAVYGKKIDQYGHKVIKEKLTNGRSIHYVAEYQKI